MTTRHEPGALDRLTTHLRKDRVARFFLAMQDRYRDIHLKDLVAEGMDDQRHIRIEGRTLVNFGSDSFLGLDRDPRVLRAIAEGARRWGSHNGTSRVFCSAAVCAEAERRLATWLGVEDTLIYPSVTLANMGAIPSLAGRRDLLVVDRLAHESVHEASKLAAYDGAILEELFPCRPEALRKLLARRKHKDFVVAVDGVYSMTGTVAPLAELDRVARSAGGILYIDDAHGTAVIGDRGRGAAYRALGHLRDVVCAGSLSKGFSCMGAYMTCSPELKLLLKMKSNTYIFGGPVPPPYLEAVCVVCDILNSPEYDQISMRLRALVDRLMRGMQSLGIMVQGGDSPIVSIIIGDGHEAFLAGKWLFERGYYVQSVTYPAVPFNGALLRIQVNANHTAEAIDGLLNALDELKQAIPLPSAPIVGQIAV
jgi:7-keto-8-aminopelargonate synthetase-like enzyme